jgi:hypothetical protein
MEDIRYILSMGGFIRNLASSVWNTCRSRRYFNWSDSDTLRLLSVERIQLVQVCSSSLECPGYCGSSQCSQPWFDHCFRIWHINNDVFPVGSSTYCRRTYCRRTSCTCAAWNYTLSSKEHRISFR